MKKKKKKKRIRETRDFVPPRGEVQIGTGGKAGF
jgi:hypothetical protein